MSRDQLAEPMIRTDRFEENRRKETKNQSTDAALLNMTLKINWKKFLMTSLQDQDTPKP